MRLFIYLPLLIKSDIITQMAAMMEANPIIKPRSNTIFAFLAPHSDVLSSEIYKRKQWVIFFVYIRNLNILLTCSPLTIFIMQKLIVPKIPINTWPVVIWCCGSPDMASIIIHHPVKNWKQDKKKKHFRNYAQRSPLYSLLTRNPAIRAEVLFTHCSEENHSLIFSRMPIVKFI